MYGGNTNARRLGIWLFALTAFMLALSFAAAPFYRLFCQATGYAGTTQRASAAPAAALDRVITVRFDTNVSPGLDWDFQPEARLMRVKIGENALAIFRAVNRSARQETGTAVFNVTPEIAGGYFDKLQCFCFTEQTLAPGQSAELPVSFFVDPAIMQDSEARRVSEITLSYTFYKAK
jgi:cytochrome c oxidase assembly protein subunit 11